MLPKTAGYELTLPNEPMKMFFMVVFVLERFIFSMQYSNMSNRPLWGADVYPWISNSNLPKQGMTDLEEYRCLLYSAVLISQDRAKAAEEMGRRSFILFYSIFLCLVSEMLFAF